MVKWAAMAAVVPSEPVAQLVAAHVNSLEKLELVVACVRAPYTTWTLGDMARQLEIAAIHLRPAIDALRASGILRLVPGIRYCFSYVPATDALRTACAALAAEYVVDREALVRAVRAVELDRNRSPATEIAEAFRLRKPVEDTDE